MPYSTRAETFRLFRRRRRRPGTRLRALVRDTVLLLKEFWPLLTGFVVTILIAAWSFYILWNKVAQANPILFVEALYIVLTLSFFEITVNFPTAWYLEAYFFIMPLIGFVFLVLGVADFAVLLFNRQSRQAEWEAALASTFSHHIIVAGLGRVGIRVVRELVKLGEDVVVIEMRSDNPRLEEIHSYDIPVIVGDARVEEVLLRAGLERAEALIICTNDDLMNLQMASRIRDMRPGIRLVMRMFDDQFARSIADRFDITAVMSSSGLAAPAFAGAATRTEIMQTFSVEDRVLSLGRIEIEAGSQIEGRTIQDIQAEFDVSVVLLHSRGTVDVHPNQDHLLQARDVIHVVAELPNIRQLAAKRKRKRSRAF